MKVAKIDGAYNRRFIRASYEENDNKAKEAIIGYLIKNGHTILDSKEDFSFDIKSKKGDNNYFSEAEMKNQWKGDWPDTWKEIRIPYRKHKLINRMAELGADNHFFNFYVIRNDAKMAWRIKDYVVAESEVKQLFSYRVKGESFFHIPYERAELVEL